MTREIPIVDCGDVVQLKKGHPCGSNEWEITRMGADIGLVCKGCGHKVMMTRSDFERHFRGIIEQRH